MTEDNGDIFIPANSCQKGWRQKLILMMKNITKLLKTEVGTK